jgi:hypothetical protein
MSNLDKTLQQIKERKAYSGQIRTIYHNIDFEAFPRRWVEAFENDKTAQDREMLLEMVDVFFKWANNCFCDDDFVCYPCGFKKELEKIAERYSK